jgi:UDP-glucose 4-epimerase
VKICVTGAAGFIGSHLVDRLLALGHAVTGLDDFSTGQPEFLKGAQSNPQFTLVRGCLLDCCALEKAVSGAELVCHLAANADVRHGLKHPYRDIQQNTLGTHNLLEAMRQAGVRRLLFSSSGAVYGEAKVFPTPEDAPFPIQTSLYAASKVAAEAFIQAYAEGFGFQTHIFRFVSILGERYTHGHVFDFCRQLRRHPDYLEVLGDGRQCKSYLHVNDCVDAMLLALEHAGEKVNIFNLGTHEYCEVLDSARWIAETMDAQPQLRCSGGPRGWVGDNPFIFLDCRRIRALGWKPRFGIREAVVRTVSYLQGNPWLFDRRE